MYKVESKYKNPDRFIDRLKSAERWAERMRRNNFSILSKAQGKQILSYASGSKRRFTVLSRRFGDLKVRQKVAIHGIVEEVIERIECLDNGENHSEITIELKEVRFYDD